MLKTIKSLWQFVKGFSLTIHLGIEFASKATTIIDRESRGDLSESEAYYQIKKLYISMKRK